MTATPAWPTGGTNEPGRYRVRWRDRDGVTTVQVERIVDGVPLNTYRHHFYGPLRPPEWREE